jgi:3-methyladenine DNA glycosylase AlkD
MMASDVLRRLKALGNPANVANMARYGIDGKTAVGVSIPALRKLAREVGVDHALALALWDADVHEVRILASMIDDPRRVTAGQMERWVRQFASWDVCDQVVSNLFDRTPLAYAKACEWIRRDAEFVRRAGFVMMATLAVHDKQAGDETLAAFLPLIEAGAGDERNFVKKAVNWALRQIGKRNLALNRQAVATARRIGAIESPVARWIAADALRELTGEAVQKRLAARRG